MCGWMVLNAEECCNVVWGLQVNGVDDQYFCFAHTPVSPVSIWTESILEETVFMLWFLTILSRAITSEVL